MKLMNKHEELGVKNLDKEYIKQREKAIKSGCYKPFEAYKVKLNINKTTLKELEQHFEDLDYKMLISSLKGNVYLDRTFNIKARLLDNAYKHLAELEERFNKPFWEEYICEYNKYITFNKMLKNKKHLEKVKQLLDDNKEFHGITGGQLQEVYNHKLKGVAMDFSWRAWGALMASYMNSKCKERKYHYMSFYM